MKAFSNDPKKNNTWRELYGACRHIPRLHRYTSYATSTDEGYTIPKRVDVSVTLEEPINRCRGRPKNIVEVAYPII